MDCKMLLISLCIILLCTICEGRPLRKRTVSEAQLLHNQGEQKLSKERREWLQMKVRSIYLDMILSQGEPAWTKGDTIRLRKRKILPKGLPDLGPLTTAEIHFVADYMEELMKKH